MKKRTVEEEQEVTFAAWEVYNSRDLRRWNSLVELDEK